MTAEADEGVLLWYWGRRGGGARYTLELARALSGVPDLRVHLSLSRQSELYAETRALGLPGIDFDTFSGLTTAARRSLALPVLTRGFISYLARERIGTVLCTMGHVWNAWVAPRVGSGGCRYLFTAHDAAPHPGDWHPGWHWLLHRNLDAADGLVALSDHVRASLVADGFPADRAWVVPLGPIAFSPTDRREPPSHPRRVLFFGRIQPYKGLPLLLDAFERIAERLDLRLTVAGAGDPGELARRMAAHPRIRWENRWISEDEVGGFFEAADLVVVPYVEASQSGVIASAYGMGLPVVVTPVGGLREQVAHGCTGLVAWDCSVDALASAIGALCSDSALYARCREGAREAGRMDQAWGAIAGRLATVLRAVRAMRPRRASP